MAARDPVATGLRVSERSCAGIRTLTQYAMLQMSPVGCEQSEYYSQSKLNDPGVTGASDDVIRPRRNRRKNRGDGIAKICMVQRIESIRSDVERVPLPVSKILGNTQIDSPQTRPSNNSIARSSEAERTRVLKSVRVKPIVDGLTLFRAWIANQVRPDVGAETITLI